MNLPTLPRRRFLRGLGTLISLPVFESLIPARVWSQEAKAAADGVSKLFPRRLIYTYSPNGKDMNRWIPPNRVIGADYELPVILQPLAEYKKDILMVSGLAQDSGTDKYRGTNDGPGDHARANATWLTGARPLKNKTILHVGTSIDQIVAQRIGDRTRLPSLELSCDAHTTAGMCDNGYSCALQYNLSWRSADEPVPGEVNPMVVFERLFGTGGPPNESAEAKAKRIMYNKSVLDFALDDAHSLQKSLGTTDRDKLDQYLTAVREVENRINTAGSYAGKLPASLQDFGSNIGNSVVNDNKGHANPHFEELAQTMYDLQVLALQSDQTRMIVFSYGHDGQNRPYPQLGIADGHHDISHHHNLPVNLDKMVAIDSYLLTLFGQFVGKLKSIQEGPDKTLLDNSMIVYGSSLSNSDRHTHLDLPTFIIGNGGGALKTGQHIDFGADSRMPLNNLHSTLAHLAGCPIDVTRDHFGDTTGLMPEVLS